MEHILSALAGIDPITWWIIGMVAAGVIAGVATGYFKAKKIQPNGFKWKHFRREVMWGVFNVTISAFVLGSITPWLMQHGVVRMSEEPASFWIVAGQYVLYFIGFDTYFYWLHRWMHIEPMYTWIHKIHHGSLSPNPMTTLSVSPLESLINGGFVPIFLLAMTFAWPVHVATFALIAPTNIIMGLYVHSGFEFLPRWWNKSWLTKWFISTTFHDQHHRFFKGNYGGYTTVWDRLCGTMRPSFEADFEKVTTRKVKPLWAGDAKQPEAVSN